MRIQSTKGAFSESLTEVMIDVRKPVFVDNALHYGKYESQQSEKPKVTISTTSYRVSKEGSYRIEEEESSLLVSHTKTAGHTFEENIFTPYGNDSSSELLYDANDYLNRLLRQKIEVLDKKIRVHLPNMKNKNLSEFNFSDEVKMGQPINVGFRTTDLALEIGKELDGTVTSFSIGEPLSVANATTQRQKHSKTFFAHNFNNASLMTALTTLGRRDNRILDYDMHGNLMFIPFNYSRKPHFLSASLRIDSENTNTVDDSANRVTVIGRQIAKNDNSSVTLNDAAQQGKFNIEIAEEPMPHFDNSIMSEQESRSVARQMLKANRLLATRMETKGHPKSWFIRPGEIVSYGNRKYVVMSASHMLASQLSDFTFLTLESGADTAIRSVFEDEAIAEEITSNDLNEQIKQVDYGFFDEIDIRTTLLVTVTDVSGTPLLIGRNANRVSIGGSGKTIGLGKKKADERFLVF
jgi:hypothetical protein|tara:strand:- start:728 stop:2122 length:1395 start_codon:yes stop_codon:yes gene_type:complete